MNRARLSNRIFRNSLTPTLNRYSRGRVIVRRDPEELKAEEVRLREWTRQQIEKYGA